MSESRVALDDQKLLNLYTRFQAARRVVGEVYPFTQFDNFLDRDSYHGGALPVVLIAKDQIMGATNALNRFGYDLHALAAWNKVFDTITEDEKFLALYEFVLPIASDSLSAPYAIKQMFVTSICQISYQTKGFGNRDEAPLKKQLNFKDARRLAANFGSWPTLCSALSLLNDEAFKDASDDYRNKLNHGFPRRIEIGHTWAINQVIEPGCVTYSLGVAPPLRIAELIPLLAKQYQIALSCFGAYIDLMKEQHALWPRAPRRT